MKLTALILLIGSTLCFAQSQEQTLPTTASGKSPTALPPERTEDGRYRFRGVVPDGFSLVSQPRYELVIPGLVSLALGFTISASYGIAFKDSAALVPVLGPWLSMSNPTGGAFGSLGYGGSFLEVISIATQAAGLLMAVVGFAVPRRWLEKSEGGASSVKISFVPSAPGARAGARVVATF